MKETYNEQLKSKEWAVKREIILKRDGFKCTKCESIFDIENRLKK